LVAGGACVHSADGRHLHVPSVTNHHLPAAESAFLPAVARIVREHGIWLVIPLGYVANQWISAGRSILGREVRVIAPGLGPATLVRDRLVALSTLSNHEVAVTRFAVPSDFSDVRAALRELGGRFVLRPRFVSDCGDTVLVGAPGDVDWTKLDDSSLIQQPGPGSRYVVVIRRPLHGGHRLTVVLEKSTGRGDSDSDVAVARVENSRTVAKVERVAQGAVRALGLTGVVEVQVAVGSDGDPMVVDVAVGFGPHSLAVPELVESVLADAPQAAPDVLVAARAGRGRVRRFVMSAP